MKLAMLMIVAPDLTIAKAFYGAVLGFTLKSQTPQRLVFAQDGADLMIFKGTKNAPPAAHGETAATTFVFAVPNLAAAMADFKAKGVTFLHDAPAQGEFGAYAAFTDPFGNVLELIEQGPP